MHQIKFNLLFKTFCFINYFFHTRDDFNQSKDSQKTENLDLGADEQEGERNDNNDRIKHVDELTDEVVAKGEKL